MTAIKTIHRIYISILGRGDLSSEGHPQNIIKLVTISSSYRSIYGSKAICWVLGALLSFLIYYTVGKTP